MKLTQTITLLLIALFLGGCVQKTIQPFEPVDLTKKLGGQYKAKIDTFHVIWDASSSMFMDYNEEMKFEQSKRTLQNMNQTIPKIDVISGIRAFGPTPYNLNDKNPLLYGMSKYSQRDFGVAINGVSTTGGGTPLAEAITNAASDLGKKPGRTALIVVSDAEDVGQAPVEAAKQIKQTYKEQICLYTIRIGKAPGSEAIMTDIANAGECGFATDYRALNTPEGMANFVEKVFLERDLNRDSDGDGVVDSWDSCPNTPKGTKVGRYGCTAVARMARIDSDRDGVYDHQDRCPATPYGLKVDTKGCPLPITQKTSIELRVEFDVDKYFVRPEYHQTLREFAAFMNDHPDLIVTIEGHTDNTGSSQYNQILSEKRAQSVSQYLSTYFDVSGKRIKSIGYGESRPETTNNTDAGMQKNRRVMAVIRADR